MCLTGASSTLPLVSLCASIKAKPPARDSKCDTAHFCKVKLTSLSTQWRFNIFRGLTWHLKTQLCERGCCTVCTLKCLLRVHACDYWRDMVKKQRVGHCTAQHWPVRFSIYPCIFSSYLSPLSVPLLLCHWSLTVTWCAQNLATPPSNCVLFGSICVFHCPVKCSLSLFW